MVGLTALLVGGVGIGNAVRGHIAAKTATIATLKCLGGSTRLVFAVYLIELLALAVLGIGVGAALGALLPLAVRPFLAGMLPVSARLGLYPAPLGLAALYGLLTVLVFSLWPLAAIGRIPAGALFRDLVDRRRWRVPLVAATMTAALTAALAALVIATAQDRALAWWFVAGAIGAFVIFRAAGAAVVAGAGKLGRPRHPLLRLALANLHRPGAPTAQIMLSLGIGLTVMVAVALVEGNLAREIEDRLPAEAPAFFFIDIQPDQLAGFEEIVRGTPGARFDEVPMMRGRITRLERRAGRARGGAARRAMGIAQRPRADLCRDAAGGLAPRRRDLVAARLSRPAAGVVRRRPGARHGAQSRRQPDASTCSGARSPRASPICGRSTGGGSASISRWCLRQARSKPRRRPISPRSICRRSQQEALVRRVTERFPNVSAIPVREALAAIGRVVGLIGAAVRLTALVALAAGALVLGGAIAASHRRRVYDAVVLKVLGATRRTVLAGFLVEYGLIGLLAALIAGALGSAGGRVCGGSAAADRLGVSAGPAARDPGAGAAADPGLGAGRHLARARGQARTLSAQRIASAAAERCRVPGAGPPARVIEKIAFCANIGGEESSSRCFSLWRGSMALGSQPRWTVRSADAQVGIDVGLRDYMLRVYNYMASGLALTGIVAYLAAASGFYMSIARTPLIWLVILAPLGLVMLMSFGVQKMQASTLQMVFWLYSGLMGLSLAMVFLVFTGTSIARVFFITAGTFAAMSLYGYTTRRDLSQFGSFLFMGLIGIIIASLVNMFVGSTALQFAISVIGVIVFVGLTAWDTQQIKEMYYEGDGAEIASKKAVMGALRLYLDFINLFMMLMQLMGTRRN